MTTKQFRYGVFIVVFTIVTTRCGWAFPDATTNDVSKIPSTKSQTSQHEQKDADAPETPDMKKEKDEYKKKSRKMSPSFQEEKWTGTQGASETNVEYDYVGRASQNIGEGFNRNIDENYIDVRHQFMRHTLLAFLVQGGFEYQHMGYGVPNDVLVPDRLDMLAGIIGIDFRWSKKDLLHIEGRPGLYTDFRGSGSNAFNCPLDVGYTRVVSNTFQWVAGFSLNTWRASRLLGAAGFRWQVNDRWKLKFYLPAPDIEYSARPDLTLTFGADVRGETYRVGPHFGDTRGAPALNSALVDYQELRVGPGFSWNVKPFIEINCMAGYMVGRQYDFYNNGPKLNGSGAPFVSLGVHALFKLPGEALNIPQQSRMSLHDIFSFF